MHTVLYEEMELKNLSGTTSTSEGVYSIVDNSKRDAYGTWRHSNCSNYP